MGLRTRIFLLIPLLYALIPAPPAYSAAPTTIPVTGNLTGLSGGGAAYTSILIELMNCPSPATIPGFYGIVQTGYQIMADSSGAVNGSIWPNDVIDCNGTTGNSQYMLSYQVNGVVAGTPQCYQVTSGSVWNLSTQQPVTCGQSPPNPQDGNFQNLTVSDNLAAASGTFSGPVIAQYFQFAGATPQSCTTGFVSGWNASGWICGSPAASPVTSVFGRTGAVVAQAGDYSYSQITGTPTIWYQTIFANGTAQTQRAGLDFSSRFAVNDSASPSKTLVDLQTTGVTAGTYDCANVTVDAFGRVTSISAAGACPTSSSADDYFKFTGCSINNSGNLNSCAGTVNFTAGGNTTPSFAAMADTNYQISCTVDTGTASSASFSVSGATSSGNTPSFTRTTTGFSYVWTEVMSLGASGSAAPEIDCHLHHN